MSDESYYLAEADKRKRHARLCASKRKREELLYEAARFERVARILQWVPKRKEEVR